MDKKELAFFQYHPGRFSGVVQEKLKADITALRSQENVDSAANKILYNLNTFKSSGLKQSETHGGMWVGSCIAQCTESQRE